LIVPNQNQAFVIHRVVCLVLLFVFVAAGLSIFRGYGTLIWWISIVSCALLLRFSVTRGLAEKNSSSLKTIKETALAKWLGINSAY